jgi:hypothetical protein
LLILACCNRDDCLASLISPDAIIACFVKTFPSHRYFLHATPPPSFTFMDSSYSPTNKYKFQLRHRRHIGFHNLMNCCEAISSFFFGFSYDAFSALSWSNMPAQTSIIIPVLFPLRYVGKRN